MITPQTRYSLYVLGAALLSAVGLVLTETALQFYRLPPFVVILLGNFAGGSVLLLASVKSRSHVWQTWRRRDWLAVISAGLLIYTVGFLFSFNAIDQIGAGKAALLGQLETPFVVVLAVIFLGEQLSARRWLAGVLALAGSVLINFDLKALQLALGWGELLALLAPFSFACGIIILKPLLDRVDAGWVTGLALLLGALFLIPAAPLYLAAVELGWVALLLIVAIGTIRGGAWLAYNVALRYIGPARCAIIFISFAFFTVLLQLVVAKLAPVLGLQLPPNLLIALMGGGLVALGIVILQTEPGLAADVAPSTSYERRT